jgi:hypothetical protein
MHVQQPRQQGVPGELDPARPVGHVGRRNDVDDAIAPRPGPRDPGRPAFARCRRSDRRALRDAFNHGGEDTRAVGDDRVDA